LAYNSNQSHLTIARINEMTQKDLSGEYKEWLGVRLWLYLKEVAGRLRNWVGLKIYRDRVSTGWFGEWPRFNSFFSIYFWPIDESCRNFLPKLRKIEKGFYVFEMGNLTIMRSLINKN
jgi:hypothetical protein